MKEKIQGDREEGVEIYSLKAIHFHFIFLIRIHQCESVVPNVFLPRRAMSYLVGYF
jgi:hypothetical protein